jgi:hypothetical protein
MRPSPTPRYTSFFKVEWHPGELYPRVGLIVTNLARPAGRVVAFYNQRGTAEHQMAEVAVTRQIFAGILSLIAGVRAPPAPA